MNLLKLLWIKWSDYEDLVYIDDVNYLEIEEFLKKKYPKCNIEITDLRKKCCSYADLKLFAGMIPIKKRKYVKETFDCEDFARVAWGIWGYIFPRLTIGYCLVYTKRGKHAVNCALYKSKSGRLNFTFIEPQLGSVFFSSWVPYKIII